MKTTILAALLAIAGLTACEKTTVNPPSSTTVVTPTVEVPSAAPAPVIVQGAPGEPGAPGASGATGASGAEGQKGEPGKTGDTVIVVPEKTN